MPEKTMSRSVLALAIGVVVLAASGGRATAQGMPNAPFCLQWFETTWRTMEYRVPDLFAAGYGSVWLPPPSKAGSTGSPGYDVFDRFDLGTPGAPTTYGTEKQLLSVVSELKKSGVQVYLDIVMNHNTGRTSDAGFFAMGGWPGFVVQQGADFWGDFHDGTKQSTNPGNPNYDLFTGDLIGLIDIAQEKNYVYIRNPVAASAQNIPAGTVWNRPDPGNARLYPDLSLPPASFINPATGAQFVIHPFNLAAPQAGDAVAENATGMLLRWTQWAVEYIGADGFRLDAAKHVPQWFWSNYWDAAVFNRRKTPWGGAATPYSFVESVESNAFTQTYIRQDGFGYRDALDLNGAGALRDLRNQAGLGSWDTVLNAHIDNQDDGFLNGTQGVTHVFSHDNGSWGDGSQPPQLPGPESYDLVQHAYIALRAGLPVIYHNGREMHDRYSAGQRGFWPREGSPTALGLLDPSLVRLVQIRNGYARGEYNPLVANRSDVLVFERRANVGGGNYAGNLLVGVNDRYDNGVQTRTVTTSFAPGTRLWELTGNHNDPTVDPTNLVAQVLTVNASRQVTLTVPNNTNINGVQHHKGYVAYGPVAPGGALSIVGAVATLPPDPAGVPAYRRRLSPLDVVATPTFEIKLLTVKGDTVDTNWDDNAVFRIDQGFRDWNGNGVTDIDQSSDVVPGFEQFVTERQPLYNTANSNGVYRQAIDATQLSEGYHYISVVAFRHRSDGGDAIYADFRRTIYVNRVPISITVLNAPSSPLPNTTYEFQIANPDRTASSVWLALNMPAGADPAPFKVAANLAAQHDRDEWRRTITNIPAGVNSVTVIAEEIDGTTTTARVENVIVTIGSGDVNRDGTVNVEDLYAIYQLTGYQLEADINKDGSVNNSDRRLLEQMLRSGEFNDLKSGLR
ncbi:MAG: hypothetical protein JNM07_06715 [Phycisphaerae bacterium]|nr:hypothetical protein [Phycisphaerae bacterium]